MEGISSAFTAIAIDKDMNSLLAVKWAVDNLFSSSNIGSKCFLTHVRSPILHHPQDFEAATNGGDQPPSEAELQQFFLPYERYCTRKGIQAIKVVLHEIDVPSAIVDFINNNKIGNIIVGASIRNVLTRNPDVPTSLLKLAPDSCTVYVISRGRVQISRLESRTQSHQNITPTPHKSPYPKAHLSEPAFDRPKAEKFSRTVSSYEGINYRIAPDRFSDYFRETPCAELKTSDEVESFRTSMGSQTPEFSNRISISDRSYFSGPPSCQSTNISYQSSGFTPDEYSTSFTTMTPRGLETEMRRLRQELKKSIDVLNSVSKEAVVAKEKVRAHREWKAAEERRLEEAKLAEETALALAEAERQKTKAAIVAAKMAQRLANMEAQKSKLSELKANRKEEEKNRAIEQLVNSKPVCRKYTIDEIEAGTNYFASSNKVGEGGYGPVFKATLDHTVVAVKVLRPDLSQGQRQFQQEVEVLSSMRHPHMVLLIGACPEYGCLVYEYMENGSLEDRLFRKNSTPSISWKTRFRIAAEIATALLFLHQTKPEALVHCDLKPANILLDMNYLSKISDVGLARLVPTTFADSVTEYHLTAAKGTFCYIDPEYQQSGRLSVKSDLYSFGVVLLQMITSLTPVGLAVHVQKAIENGTFVEMLDPTVPDWPIEEALSLAKLALQCCELRKKDRPDLGSVVLPELNRLRDFALVDDKAKNNEETAFEPPLCSSDDQQIGSQENDDDDDQVSARSGWQRLKSATRSWKASFFPSNERPTGKITKQKPSEIGCWSFVNCSGAPQHSTTTLSFS